MDIKNSNHLSINQIQDQYLKQARKTDNTAGNGAVSFQEMLESLQNSRLKSTEQVTFSKHAAGRLSDRNIELTDNQLERLNDGTRKAGEKGIKESLVLVDQLAFIVNVPNNTVITAMDQTDTNENVFTNIDGAVII